MKISNVDDYILKNIKNSMLHDEEVNRNWHQYARFVFEKTLSESDIAELQRADRDTFDFNIVMPYIWQSLKNVKESAYTAMYKLNKKYKGKSISQIDSDTIIEILNDKLESIKNKSNHDNIIYLAAIDAFIGGKGVLKVKNHYVNEYNFEQDLKIEHVLNPTNIFFDCKAKHPTKCDGEYVFEKFQANEADLQKKYSNVDFNGINYKYTNDQLCCFEDDYKDKLINVIDYYYKDKKYQKIYRYETGEISSVKIEGLKVLQERKVCHTVIKMIRLVGNVVLEKKDTNFKSLPYICLMGRRFIDCGEKEKIYPYAKQAFDAQRVKNIMMNYFLYEALNNRSAGWSVPVECVVDDATIKAIKNPAFKNYLPYKAIHNVNGQIVMVKPEPLNGGQLPTQYLEAFNVLDSTVQASLGVQFPSLNDTNMSGKSLYNLTQYMSASNSQFMQHLEGVELQLAKVILETLPSIIEKERFIIGEQDVNFDFLFEQEMAEIYLKSGVSSTLQKEHNVEILMDFSKTNPLFNQFLNTPEGVHIILDNVDINKKSELTAEFDKFIQKQQQAQQSQITPQQIEMEKVKADMLDSQAKLINSQANMQRAQANVADMAASHQHSHNQLLLEYEKLDKQGQIKMMDNMLKLANTNLEFKKSLISHLLKLKEVKNG